MITDDTLRPVPLYVLRRALDTVGYDSVLRQLRGPDYFAGPWPQDVPGLLSGITRLPDGTRGALELFALARSVDAARARRA